jgi:hypothetical protein
MASKAFVRALLTLLAVAPVVCSAADRLNGKWRSDHDASMTFIKSHVRLEPRQLEFLDGSLGRMQLSFDGTRIRRQLPDFDVTIQGSHRHMIGADEAFSYRVLGSDADSVAILVAGDHGRDRILHIHFATEDSFWLYSEETDYGLRDLNFREYFRRIE